jgi:chemotaxis protein CheD
MKLMQTSKPKIQQILNMGQWFVTDDVNCELITPSLGSCVAVCLYENNLHLAGMAHVVLPSRMTRKLKSQNEESFPSAKYADEVIKLLMKEMVCFVGHNRLNVEARIAGGAQLFSGSARLTETKSSKKPFPLIGSRNVEVLRTELKIHKIPLVSSDVEGNNGRTVSFDVATGEIFVKTIGSGGKDRM